MAYDESMWVVEQITDKLTAMGYPPKAMRGYNVQAASGGKVKLYFTPPANTYISEGKQIPLVQVGGVMIRKKAGSPITSLTDGELLTTIPAEDMNNYITTPFIDEDVEIGTKYYYRFFPFSTQGTYNTQDDSQHGVTVTQEGSMLIFGFDQSFDDLNPETQITYPADCENSNYSPMAFDGSSWGGWEHFIKNVLQCAPYMVKYDGTADYPLNPENLSKKLDGTTSDYLRGTAYPGSPMVWLRNLYVKVWGDDDLHIRHVRFCEGIPIGESGWYRLIEKDKKGFWFPICRHRNGTTTATFTQNESGEPASNTARRINNTTGTAQLSTIEENLANIVPNGQLVSNTIAVYLRDLFYMIYKNVSNDYSTQQSEFYARIHTLKGVNLGENFVTYGFCPDKRLAFFSPLVLPSSSLHLDDIVYNFTHVIQTSTGSDSFKGNNFQICAVRRHRKSSWGNSAVLLGYFSSTAKGTTDYYSYIPTGGTGFTAASSLNTQQGGIVGEVSDSGSKQIPSNAYYKDILSSANGCNIGSKSDAPHRYVSSNISGFGGRYRIVSPKLNFSNATLRSSYIRRISYSLGVQAPYNHIIGSGYVNGIMPQLEGDNLINNYNQGQTNDYNAGVTTVSGEVNNAYVIFKNVDVGRSGSDVDLDFTKYVQQSTYNTSQTVYKTYSTPILDSVSGAFDNALWKAERYNDYGVAFCIYPPTNEYSPVEEV